MNIITLLTVNIVISSICVFFVGTLIFILMGMYKEHVKASKKVAEEVEGVKNTLKQTSRSNVDKMDELAKEETLGQFVQKRKEINND